MKRIAGSFTRPKGFLVGSAACGLKSGKDARDVVVFASETDAAAAAVFTSNPVCGAPVIVDRQRIGSGRARAIVVNAGNANVCTGTRGIADAKRMASDVAQCLSINPERVLVASTGIIGERLPMKKIRAGICAACDNLGRSLKHDRLAAGAILTTDLARKECAVTCRIGGATVTVGGMAKGSGMIAPNMGTLLAFISTDCLVDPPVLARTLRRVTADTFNCVTVDGDQSTSDSVFLLANGCAGNRKLSRKGAGLPTFEKALHTVMEKLAKDIAADGEGATKLVEVVVSGARSVSDAHAVAKAIAESPLVKTALFGEDPNWGRILAAAGYSGAMIAPDKVRLSLGGKCICRNGRAVGAKQNFAKIMRRKTIRIQIDLGLGRAGRTVWTCDLTGGYIKINAHYHT